MTDYTTMTQQIDALLAESLAQGAYAGAAAAVYQNGKCLYLGVSGYSDREAGRKMTPDTIFRIYSMTKPVTAAAVMLLIERGLLHPDQLLSEILPEFSHMQVISKDGTLRPAAEPIRIRHLLTMQSGLPYAGDQTPAECAADGFFKKLAAMQEAGERYTTRDVCRGIAGCPLAFEPGTHWLYGTSADVLGGVVEAVTGMTYRAYLQTHFFRPLGMDDTDFWVPPEKQERFANAYEPLDGVLVRDEKHYFALNDYRTLPAFFSGGAGLTSTVTDYAKFAQMLANRGTGIRGEQILKPDSVDYLRSPQISAEKLRCDQDWDSLCGYDYGNLVRVLRDPAAFHTDAIPGEFGWDGWTGTYFCTDTANRLSILFFIQRSCAGTSETAKRLRNIVYRTIL